MGSDDRDSKEKNRIVYQTDPNSSYFFTFNEGTYGIGATKKTSFLGVDIASENIIAYNVGLVKLPIISTEITLGKTFSFSLGKDWKLTSGLFAQGSLELIPGNSYIQNLYPNFELAGGLDVKAPGNKFEAGYLISCAGREIYRSWGALTLPLTHDFWAKYDPGKGYSIQFDLSAETNLLYGRESSVENFYNIELGATLPLWGIQVSPSATYSKEEGIGTNISIGVPNGFTFDAGFKPENNILNFGFTIPLGKVSANINKDFPLSTGSGNQKITTYVYKIYETDAFFSTAKQKILDCKGNWEQFKGWLSTLDFMDMLLVLTMIGKKMGDENAYNTGNGIPEGGLPIYVDPENYLKIVYKVFNHQKLSDDDAVVCQQSAAFNMKIFKEVAGTREFDVYYVEGVYPTGDLSHAIGLIYDKENKVYATLDWNEVRAYTGLGTIDEAIGRYYNVPSEMWDKWLQSKKKDFSLFLDKVHLFDPKTGKEVYPLDKIKDQGIRTHAEEKIRQ